LETAPSHKADAPSMVIQPRVRYVSRRAARTSAARS